MTDDPRAGWTSASNAEADSLCPGRHLAQKGLPESPESEDAASGTRIHAFLAVRTAALSPDEQEVADRCAAIQKSTVDEWAHGKNFMLSIEKRLWCKTGKLHHSGQPDLVAYLDKEDKALVIDYKTGRNEAPEPNTNQQLRDLAVLASQQWPTEEVTVCIVQPFAKRQPPCVYDASDLKRATDDLKKRIRASNNPKSPRIAGEKQCRYCRAKNQCKEYAAWTSTALPLIASADLGIQKPWTPEQWSQFLTIAPEAESWIEAKRQEAKAMLKDNPDSIPGFTLEDSGTREKITNAQAVFEQAALRGVTTEAFMGAVTVTKKGLKNALRGTGLAGKALDQAMTEVLFGNVEEKEIEPKIVRKK